MADENSTPTNYSEINPALAPKLTDWAKEPSVQALAQDIEGARPAHDIHAGRVQRWNDLLQVTGSAKIPKIKGRSRVQPKLIRRQAEWRYSALTEPFNSSQKLFTVSPVTFEDENAARQNELVLNWQFRTKLNRVRFIDDYVRANVDEGSAIVRVGWSRVTKEVEKEVPVWTYMAPTDPIQIQELEMAVGLKEQDPRTYADTVPENIRKAVEYFEETGEPSIAEQTGTETVLVTEVIDNRPLIEVVNPANIYFDPTCGSDLEKSTFVGETFETCKADLLKEPERYKNLDFVDWEGASSNHEPNHTARSVDLNFNFKDTLRKKVVAYTYWGLWDIAGNGELVPIVATWIGQVMIRLELNPFPDGKPPYIVVNYMPKKRELLGEPDAELLEDNQKISGALTRGMIDLLARSANSQQGFAKGMLDPLNKRKFENGDNYEFNPSQHPDGGFKEHKYPELPQSALIMLQSQNQEAEALTGVKAFAGGLSGEAYGDVAAGIRGVLDAASKREMAILRRLASGLVLIGKKIAAMNAIFLSEEETVRVTNEEFVTVKREELAGDYDLEVDISTAEIDNNKAQDLAFMLQTMGNTVDFGIVKMILIEIARLKRMYVLVEQLKRYEPKPDPLAVALKEAEVMKLQKEVELLQSEIDLNLAKAERERAQANHTLLDAVEQETGTTHARGVEMAGAQAAANRDLEITKALTKPIKQANGGEKQPDIEAAVGWSELARRLRDPRNNNNDTIVGGARQPVLPPETEIIPSEVITNNPSAF